MLGDHSGFSMLWAYYRNVAVTLYSTATPFFLSVFVWLSRLFRLFSLRITPVHWYVATGLISPPMHKSLICSYLHGPPSLFMVCSVFFFFYRHAVLPQPQFHSVYSLIYIVSFCYVSGCCSSLIYQQSFQTWGEHLPALLEWKLKLLLQIRKRKLNEDLPENMYE